MWDYIAPGTAIVLAVMGIIPALSAFRQRTQVLWISGIIIIVIVSMVASAQRPVPIVNNERSTVARV